MTDDSGSETGRALDEHLARAVEPLDAVDPAADFDDLRAVGDAIGGADVVGMGEASHGTREFFQLKRRLFRYLVAEHGVRTLGLEANFAAVLDVNDYVLRGTGTAEAALLQDAIHGTYRTAAILDLVEWIRRFNESRERADRIRFHGIDVQDASAPVERLESYFETVDPSQLDAVRDDLDRLADDGIPNVSDDERLRDHVDARERVVSALGGAIEDREAEYVDATSRQAYRRAERLVWTLEQGRRQFEAIATGRAKHGANVRIRDSAMAAQVGWLLSHEPGDGIALWGHNAHLTRGPFGGGTVRHRQGIPSLGKNLATLGSVEYYALGLLLGGGTVRAEYVPEGEARRYDIEAPPEGSIPDVFGRVDHPAFFLDVRSLPADSPLAEWFETRPRHFDVVGGYAESPVNLVGANLREWFDGVVFVDDTTAARPPAEER